MVGSKMGGIPELLDEGVTGELFEAGNPDELECKLRKLLVNPETLARYSENCLKKTFENPDSYYKKLMDVYGA